MSIYSLQIHFGSTNSVLIQQLNLDLICYCRYIAKPIVLNKLTHKNIITEAYCDYSFSKPFQMLFLCIQLLYCYSLLHLLISSMLNTYTRLHVVEMFYFSFSNCWLGSKNITLISPQMQLPPKLPNVPEVCTCACTTVTMHHILNILYDSG